MNTDSMKMIDSQYSLFPNFKGFSFTTLSYSVLAELNCSLILQD